MRLSTPSRNFLEFESEAAIADGRADFVFSTPEQLADPELRELLQRRPVGLFVVDEAHCISQWGHDFLTLGDVINDLGHPPVVALTAALRKAVEAMTGGGEKANPAAAAGRNHGTGKAKPSKPRRPQ
jgi:hypothetical protein